MGKNIKRETLWVNQNTQAFWRSICLCKQTKHGSSCNMLSVQGFNWRPMDSLWEVLHFKHSVVINFVVSRMPLWHFQRGVITQDRSPTSAPDLCQKEIVTGIVLSLSHVYDCLYLKRPQGAFGACRRSNIEQQWETGHDLMKVFSLFTFINKEKKWVDRQSKR